MHLEKRMAGVEMVVLCGRYARIELISTGKISLDWPFAVVFTLALSRGVRWTNLRKCK
jgi:hypothetical protein